MCEVKKCPQVLSLELTVKSKEMTVKTLLEDANKWRHRVDALETSLAATRENNDRLNEKNMELEGRVENQKSLMGAYSRNLTEKEEELDRKEEELQRYEAKLYSADNLVEVLQSEVALLRYKVREANRVLGQTPRDSTEACNGVDAANPCDGPCAPVCNGGTLVQPCRDTGCDKCYPGWTPPA